MSGALTDKLAGMTWGMECVNRHARGTAVYALRGFGDLGQLVSALDHRMALYKSEGKKDMICRVVSDWKESDGE